MYWESSREFAYVGSALKEKRKEKRNENGVHAIKLTLFCWALVERSCPSAQSTMCPARVQA